MEKLTVEAPSGSYDILIGRGLLDNIGKELRTRGIGGAERPVAVLTSPRIGGYYFDRLRLSLEKNGIFRIGRYDIPDGEEHKNLHYYAGAIGWLSGFTGEGGVTPLVITLGGGVVGDLGGFVAHTFRRGVPFVQATTTLLGAVDCSVGGKVAVNLPEGKNMVGAFHQPSLVLADLDCLNTLPVSEIRSGMAEVIKYGIAMDAALLSVLERDIEGLMDLRRELLEPVVKRCCEIKADVVARDEYDSKGVRVVLNFGHTVGHALENVLEYALPHGSCVSIGMVAAARLSVNLGMCGSEVPDRISSLLRSAGLPVNCEDPAADPDRVLEVMRRDKKWIHGKSRFILLTGPGSWKDVEDVDMGAVKEVLDEVLNG